MNQTCRIKVKIKSAFYGKYTSLAGAIVHVLALPFLEAEYGTYYPSSELYCLSAVACMFYINPDLGV